VVDEATSRGVPEQVYVNAPREFPDTTSLESRSLIGSDSVRQVTN